ncbi:MAG TPA: glycosyltransferase family 39 protein [Vicinamibacterales bacterium]|nr:glycosyltransferase family 39 protein [Vicinamibacterales bacterium]
MPPAGDLETVERRTLGRAGLVAVCLLALYMGATALTDDRYASPHGDMPRYLMNGVYLMDLVRDRPFANVNTFVEYTRLYYARYPALSLGHHPPLVSAAAVPMYAVFGISVRSGRFTVLVAFIIATLFLYRLTQAIYDPVVALLAAAIFATSPTIVQLGTAVSSEIPMVALIIVSAWYLHRFCVNQRRADLALFVVAATLSLYAKQLALFVFPAYLITAVMTLGLRRLLQRDVLIAVAVLFILVLPLVPMTLALSPSNVRWAVLAFNEHQSSRWSVLSAAVRPQLIALVVVFAGAGALRATLQRDRRAVLFLGWTAAVLIGLLTAGLLDPSRYSIAWIPALSVLAASVAAGWRRSIAVVLVAIVLMAVGFQIPLARRAVLKSVGDYEDAARFVLASDPGPTVLFSGDIDTGFFTFFIRKHDADRKLVVLRADKLLTTSRMGLPSIEDRISDPAEIYDILRRFGTRYVVLEDRPSVSAVLEWLRQEVRSRRFVERRRFAMDVSRSLSGYPVVVYEFLDRTPPDSDAVLSMRIPLVSQTVEVALSDLVNRKYLR